MIHQRYFISACLLGQKVRYDGKDCLVSQLVEALLDKNYVSLCPEVSAGLNTSTGLSIVLTMSILFALIFIAQKFKKLT